MLVTLETEKTQHASEKVCVEQYDIHKIRLRVRFCSGTVHIGFIDVYSHTCCLKEQVCCLHLVFPGDCCHVASLPRML